MTKIVDITILRKAKEYRDTLLATFIFGNEKVEINVNMTDAELVEWYKSLHHDETDRK